MIILAAAGLLFVTANLVQPRSVKHRVFNIKQGSSLQIGNAKLEVEIADTETERARGLSGRAALEENRGMLFVFDEPGQYGFWMKDMNFPIDIVWIDENWRVAGITGNVSPDSYPQVFYPPRPIKYALEVNTGFAITHHLTIGTQIVSKYKKVPR